MDPPFDVNANVRRLIRLLADAYEARLDGLNQRETHSAGMAQSVFLRKTCTCSSYYHISHQLCLANAKEARDDATRGASTRFCHPTLLCDPRPADACVVYR